MKLFSAIAASTIATITLLIPATVNADSNLIRDRATARTTTTRYDRAGNKTTTTRTQSWRPDPMKNNDGKRKCWSCLF